MDSGAIDHLGRAHVLEASPDAGRRAGPAEVVLDEPVYIRTLELLDAWRYETHTSGQEITPEGFVDELKNSLAMARAELPEGFEPLAAIRTCACGQALRSGRETCSTYCAQMAVWMEKRARFLAETATHELVSWSEIR